MRASVYETVRLYEEAGQLIQNALSPRSLQSSVHLHYHHTYYAEKLSGDMKVQWAALKDRDLAAASINLSDEDYAEFTKLLPDQPYLPIGANPRVFQYGFDQHSDPVNDICALRFYEGETIYVHWKKLPAQVWSTTLEIVADYFKEFPQMQLPSLIGIHESERVELLRQCAARSRRLAEIVRQARHKQDIAAYGLAKMLREENYRNKLRLSRRAGDRSDHCSLTSSRLLLAFWLGFRPLRGLALSWAG